MENAEVLKAEVAKLFFFLSPSHKAVTRLNVFRSAQSLGGAHPF